MTVAGNARRYKREQGRGYTKRSEREKGKIVQEKKEMRGGIFRRVSAMYHEVVNSDSRLFPRKL